VPSFERAGGWLSHSDTVVCASSSGHAHRTGTALETAKATGIRFMKTMRSKMAWAPQLRERPVTGVKLWVALSAWRVNWTRPGKVCTVRGAPKVLQCSVKAPVSIAVRAHRRTSIYHELQASRMTPQPKVLARASFANRGFS